MDSQSVAAFHKHVYVKAFVVMCIVVSIVVNLIDLFDIPYKLELVWCGVVWWRVLCCAVLWYARMYAST